MKHKTATTVTIRLLERRLDELLAELRAVAPELVKQLEQTMAALREQPVERGEYEGLDRGAAIHKYLAKVGKPTELRQVCDALEAPNSRFNARSIWDGAKREVEFRRVLNVADKSKGEAWVLALPEWRKKA